MNTMAAPMMTASGNGTSLTTRGIGLYARIAEALQWLSPVADLALRLYVANAFWASGVSKIQSWDTTLQLFEYEYHVPLLSPTLAAYAGTFTELFFPVMLVLGLGGRFAAFVLLVFNIVAVISYSELMGVGLEQHKVWGLMLSVLLLHGPGALSADHWLRRRIAMRG